MALEHTQHIVQQHAADIIEKTAPLASKAGIVTGVTTYGATTYLTLSQTAQIVSIICTVVATSSAVLFGYLNYRLRAQRAAAAKQAGEDE